MGQWPQHEPFDPPKRHHPCKACNGTGLDPLSWSRGTTCPDCKGTGINAELQKAENARKADR